MAVDLSVLGDLAIDVARDRLLRPASPPVIRTLASPPPDVGGFKSPIGIPFGEIVGDPGTSGEPMLKWSIKDQAWLPYKKRRRRRALLTNSDFNDVLKVSVLPNSKNVSIALMKALGRRG